MKLRGGAGFAGWLAFVLLATCVSPARPQGMLSSTMSPSPRSIAMGNAGVALPADDPFVAFLNPALLPSARGIHWGSSRTRLLPGVADDIVLNADYVTLGVGGVGFEFTGRPFSALGSTQLDLGARYIIAPLEGGGSDTVGYSHQYEQTREFGIGADIFHVAHGIARLSGHDFPNIAEHFDISLGIRWKRFVEGNPFVYAFDYSDSSEAWRGTARDWGALARITPYRNIAGEYRGGKEQTGGSLAGVGGLSVDLYAGYSRLNSRADTVTFSSSNERMAPESFRRVGVGVRLATGLPKNLQASDFGDIPRATRYLGPTAVFSIGYETVFNRDSVDNPNRYVGHAVGAELTVLGIVTGRIGHYEDKSLAVSGATAGFALRLHYADAVSLTYEWASRPSISLKERVHPYSWQVLLNPYGVLKVVLGG